MHIQHRTDNPKQQSGHKRYVPALGNQTDNQTTCTDGPLLSYDRSLTERVILTRFHHISLSELCTVTIKDKYLNTNYIDI